MVQRHDLRVVLVALFCHEVLLRAPSIGRSKIGALHRREITLWHWNWDSRAERALITGGSKGIGRAIGRGLARQGVNLVLLARGQELLEKTAEEIRKDTGVKVLATVADITKSDQVDASAAAAKETFGTVNIVVNNAGGPMRRMDRQILWPDSDWLGDLDNKILGALRVTRAFLSLCPSDGTGRIINISGTASTIVWAPALTHGLNNAAMNQATGYLAADLASQQITVNTVVPGLVGTEGREVWAENMAKQQNVTKEEFVSGFCKRMGILAGRWATMDEVADTVVFLASDRARYFNGSKIILDGGLNVNARPA
jgi:NAD(P)-dependent dehydrogenase (short-subunit alcohol dehydrogenase family)